MERSVPQRNGFRVTGWLDRLGEDYVDIAYRAARKADPSAKLFYNDYLIEADNPKSRLMLAKLLAFRKAGMPIDGIGLQTHMKSFPFNSPSIFTNNFQMLQREGFDLAITEMDVPLQGSPSGGYKTEEETRAAIYRQFTEWVIEFKFVGLLVWGLYDPQSWVYHFPDVFPGGSDPLLFDWKFQPKPSYFAVSNDSSLSN